MFVGLLDHLDEWVAQLALSTTEVLFPPPGAIFERDLDEAVRVAGCLGEKGEPRCRTKYLCLLIVAEDLVAVLAGRDSLRSTSGGTGRM